MATLPRLKLDAGWRRRKMCLVLSLPDVMLFVLDNKASVARHANDRQDFTLLEQDQPMAEEEEEGMRGSERRKYYNGKDNE